jgi:hypothetical protein
MVEDYEIIATFEGLTIQEAKLSYAAREKLSPEAFCGPNKSYPAHDASHVRNGLAKLSQFGAKMKPEVSARIHNCLKAKAKKFGIEVGETLMIEKKPLLKWYLEEIKLNNNK